MPPDPTHWMNHVNQLIWDGKVETLGELVADVEYDYTLSNPQTDCTIIRVLQILQKIGVKNVTLSNALMNRLSDNSLTYSYAAVQRAAEEWMWRECSVTPEVKINEDRRHIQSKSSRRNNSTGPVSRYKSQSPQRNRLWCNSGRE